MNKKTKLLSTEEKIMLANISYGIATLILLSFFTSLFFLYHKNAQDIIMRHHLDITSYILFLCGFLFTTLGSELEDAVKKEKLENEIITVYTDNNSIISVINYAKEKNIPFKLIYDTLNDFDSSLFHKK
jgi:hypothetical protein